jgi:predicted permease
MRAWRAALLRIRGLFGRQTHDRDVNDEIDAHLQFHIDDNLRSGMPPDQARREALLRFGGVRLAHEQQRDRRGFPALDALIRDLRYAARLLAKHPAFAGAAILTLALGIGANTAMFSFADATAFRPPDVPRAGELVRLFTSSKDAEYDRLSYPEYLDYKARTTTLSSAIAYDTALVAMARSRDEVPQLFGAWVVTTNFFSALEVPIALGRGFRDDEGRVAGADPVAVISHRLWQRHFQSDRAIVGRRVTLGTREFTVVGVAPAGFAGTELYFHPDLYVPITMSRDVLSTLSPGFLEDRSNRWLNVLGRLKQGGSVSQTNAEVAALARSLEQAHPESGKNRTALVLPEVKARAVFDAGGHQGAALMLMIVGLVLLIACANVANLLLARAAGRTREMAMRVALGASRGRLIQQLLTESVLLSLIGGALGLLVAYWSLAAVSSLVGTIMAATDMPLALDVRLDQRTLFFTAAISIATGLTFGLTPAFLSTRVDLIPALKTPTAAAGGRRPWFNLRNILVSSQVALAVVVLTVAGLAIRAVIDKQHIDPGFRADHVLLMSFNPGLVHFDQAQSRTFYQNVLERTKSLPGVSTAGLAQFIPLGNNGGSMPVVVDGFAMPPGQDRLTIRNNVVDDGYWASMRTAVVRGRPFDPRDTASSLPVAIVNETMARRYWPQQDAIGKTLRLRDRNGPVLQVVGIARDGKYGEIAETPQPYLFLPFAQRFRPMMTMIVLAKGDPASLAAPIRAEVQAAGAGVPAFDIRTLDNVYQSRAMAPARLTSLVMMSLGLLGTILAVVGLYGVMAYLTSLRKREIGVRMAIGADRSSIVRLVLQQAAGVVGVGLAAGVVLTIATTPLLAVPFDFRARDAAVMIIVPLILMGATFAATLVPACRAAMTDPATVLRDE